MGGMKLAKEDIFLDLKVPDMTAAIQAICAHLLREEKIAPDFEKHLLLREEEYPTGLKLGKINVAIPHADYEYSKTTQLVVATLESPVLWNNMENPDEALRVSVVVMSLFDKPEKQIEALKQIMGVIQSQEALQQIVNATTFDQVVEAFNKGRE